MKYIPKDGEDYKKAMDLLMPLLKTGKIKEISVKNSEFPPIIEIEIIPEPSAFEVVEGIIKLNLSYKKGDDQLI
jgi:hypothetical protein